MSRLALFEEALRETEVLQRRYPAVQTLQSIAEQLRYLISLINGSSVDRSRLREVVLGIQAAREVEPLSQALANLLYKVDEEVGKM